MQNPMETENLPCAWIDQPHSTKQCFISNQRLPGNGIRLWFPFFLSSGDYGLFECSMFTPWDYSGIMTLSSSVQNAKQAELTVGQIVQLSASAVSLPSPFSSGQHPF